MFSTIFRVTSTLRNDCEATIFFSRNKFTESFARQGSVRGAIIHPYEQQAGNQGDNEYLYKVYHTKVAPATLLSFALSAMQSLMRTTAQKSAKVFFFLLFCLCNKIYDSHLHKSKARLGDACRNADTGGYKQSSETIIFYGRMSLKMTDEMFCEAVIISTGSHLKSIVFRSYSHPRRFCFSHFFPPFGII